MNRNPLGMAALCGAAAALSSGALAQTDAPAGVDTARLLTQVYMVASQAFSGGALTLTTDDDSQQIEIQTGPQPGFVKVIGVDGASAEYSGVTSIDLTTGAGQDYVEFRIFGPIVPNILVNTGTNNSDVKLIYQIPYTTVPVSTMVSVIGADQNDKVAFEVLNSVETLIADWSVAHGNGANETKVLVDTPEGTTLTSIALSTLSGAGKDKLDAAFKSGAATVDLEIDASLGNNSDSSIISVTEQEAGFTRLAVNIDLGRGLDVSEIITVLNGGTTTQTGVVKGGGGDDFLKMLQEGDGSNSIVLNSGGGDDYIDMEFKGAVTGSPKQRAAAGDDFLKLVATQPGLMSPLMDGGPGFDVAHGFGAIINVEDFD